MTASWLIQMGWSNVYVLADGLTGQDLVQGPHIPKIAGFIKEEVIKPLELNELLGSNRKVCVIDFATSRQYRSCHIASAKWCVRSRISVDLKSVSQFDRFIFTSPDGVLAHLAARDMRAIQPNIKLQVLEGGTDAWVEAALPTENGLRDAMSPVNDVWYKPYELTDAPEKAMQDYLDWEVALVEQIKRDDTVSFLTR
jgi:rhodanese-related sulfurtransferase